MLGQVGRLLKAESSEHYIRRVAAALLRDGLSPTDLDDLQSVPALEESGRILGLLREQNLSPAEAARALRLAANLFHKTKQIAALRGWPLKVPPSVRADLPANEAYFLELLAEAADSVQGCI